MAKTKRKRKTGAGTAIYVVILTLWILLIAAGCLYILSQIWVYASAYDDTLVEPVIESYVANLRENLWDDSIAETVEAMPHPYQSDEEVRQLVREILMTDEISYRQKTGAVRSDSITYHLLCGENAFGEVTLVADTSKNLVENVSLPSALVGALARMGVSIQPELYPWKVSEEHFDFSGLYSSATVTAPKNYRVMLNGVTLGEEYITEQDIHFDNLEPYYYRYDNLPTKVTYKLDNSMGDATVVVYDEDGNVFSVDENKSDYQFMTPLDEGTVTSLDSFITGFADKFLQMRSNTSDPVYTYGELKPYIKAGTDLDNRLKQSMIDTWSHNSYYQFNGCEITNAYYFFKDQMYVIEFHAEASAQQPAGPNVLSSDFRVLVDMSSGGPLVVEVEDV